MLEMEPFVKGSKWVGGWVYWRVKECSQSVCACLFGLIFAKFTKPRSLSPPRKSIESKVPSMQEWVWLYLM